MGTFSGAKAKPESVNILLDLSGINARILFKEHQQQESPEESPAAAGRGAEGRIHEGKAAAAVGTKG